MGTTKRLVTFGTGKGQEIAGSTELAVGSNGKHDVTRKRGEDLLLGQLNTGGSRVRLRQVYILQENVLVICAVGRRNISARASRGHRRDAGFLQGPTASRPDYL